MTTQELIIELENARAFVDDYKSRMDGLIEDATPAEVKADWAEIRDEYEPMIEESAKAIRELEAEVKAAVIAGGETVKGRILQAVYSKGRSTWDTTALINYAKADPKLLRFQKVGEPSVSFRAVK